MRRAFDGFMLIDVFDNLLNLLDVISEPFVRPRGSLLLVIFRRPPPTSFLYLMTAISASTPVVPQSIIKAFVPVGASTEICEFFTPYFSASSQASSHASRAAVRRSSGT